MTKSDILEEEDPRQNNILATLHKADYERILPDLKLVEMPLGWTIAEAGDHVKFIHFPISGIVSLIYELEVGISIYMGGDSMPSSTEVQSEGKAYRLSRSILKREFALGGHLQQVALLYTQALIAQTSQTAVCNQHHSLEQQLCRWLLMTLDRLPSNQVVITHILIAKLLGVRRESISEAAAKLQKDGLITYSRGQITVESLPKLKKRVCECYEVVTNEYARLLPTIE